MTDEIQTENVQEQTEQTEHTEQAAEAEIVPEYTLDDFVSGERPYEDVYVQRTNPFAHERAKYQMEQRAQKVGFKNFKAFYKQYCESRERVAKNDLQYITNPTEFSGQPLQLEGGKWKCTDGGVVGFDGSGGECIACHHPIMPIEVLENIDTGEEKLRIAYRKRGVWREIVVSKTVLFNSRKITDLAASGIDVTSESAKLLVAYLQDMENLNLRELPLRKSVGRMGYVSGGFAPYVDGLVFDGEAAYAPIYKAIRAHGDYEKWLSYVKKLRGESVIAKIVIAASFASVLVQPLGALPFFVHLWGVDSGTGKTVGLMAAASVWGSPALGEYIQTFNSTQVSNERTAAFLNSLPLMMDELQLSKDSRGRSNFSVYQLAQGVGRGRGNKYGGIDSTPTWGNTIITTGESPLVGGAAGAGAVNRVIDIECRADTKVVTDGISASATLKQNYGFAGQYFVARVQKPQVLEQAREIFNDYFAELCKSDTTEKQAMAAAMILTADLLAEAEIFGGESPLRAADIAPFLARKSEVSAGERGYKFLCDWVVINSKRFAMSEENGGEVYGVIENGVAYIIRAKFTEACEHQGFDPRAQLSWLKVNMKILTRGRNFTRGKRINGNNVECVALKLPEANEREQDLQTDYAVEPL